MNKNKMIPIIAAIVFIIVVVTALIYLLYPKILLSGNVKVKINSQEWRVEVAQNDWSRAKGLSGRKFIGENDGMLFIFNEPAIQKFWMRGMKFPLDIIWIKNNKVVGLAENVSPATISNLELRSSPEPVNLVLEINAGSAKKWGIREGSEVFIYSGGKLVLY